jgi:alpha-tubulin suppressor-like RCC1 family protein
MSWQVVTQICGGHGHTVALTAEGKVYTFGSSVFGQLGNGSNIKSSVPVHVTALTERITIIATNYFHNVSIKVTV